MLLVSLRLLWFTFIGFYVLNELKMLLFDVISFCFGGDGWTPPTRGRPPFEGTGACLRARANNRKASRGYIITPIAMPVEYKQRPQVWARFEQPELVCQMVSGRSLKCRLWTVH
jgi:hypothetical protein